MILIPLTVPAFLRPFCQRLGAPFLGRVVPVLCLAMALGSTAVAWFGVVAPAIARYNDTGRVLTELERVQAEQIALHRRRVDAARRVRNLQAEAIDMPSRLGDAGQLNPRIGRMLALAERHEVAVDAIRPGIPEAQAFFARTPITLRVSGSYPAISELSADLHATFPDTQAWSLRLTGAPGRSGIAQAVDSDSPRVEGVFEIDWFTAIGLPTVERTAVSPAPGTRVSTANPDATTGEGDRP